MNGDCEECDEPQTWGGMSWTRHTDGFHIRRRRALIKYIARRLTECTATRAGHRITLRFTANHAWFECSCGEHGGVCTSTMAARTDARDHLFHEGLVAQ